MVLEVLLALMLVGYLIMTAVYSRLE